MIGVNLSLKGETFSRCECFLPVGIVLSTVKVYHNLSASTLMIILNTVIESRTSILITLQINLNPVPTLTNFLIFSLCILVKFGITYLMSYFLCPISGRTKHRMGPCGLLWDRMRPYGHLWDRMGSY